ncbi:uncharacterized protein MELLADRAFT_107520 [Melampsora larici-populina 98AG31]|uniref:Uncharacterized protein n=1 Tax=Melampsora larici-populina (strain 98AG31 / pathotype 3-4-7) TaxID=747676 RepID=F4RQI8_MELLP|nr:uncharacterized protein MELLADRAFT_107520 [Melampsora larici-populina 98AG31]EGG05305.1 hypothetical protein MELLADRAFT_107520 [Melampsora larici-populina 98AG31]
MSKGRVEAAIAQWASSRFKNQTKLVCNNSSLSSWVTTTSKKNAVTKPCSGLHDKNWKRPRGKTTIANCIKHSPTPYHGAKRWKVCLRLFGTTHEITLSDEQRQQLHSTLEAEATWMIKRHGAQAAIHSVECTRTVVTTSKVEFPICENCEALKKHAANPTCPRYDVVYKDGLENSLDTAVAAAAKTVDEQQRTDVLMSNVPDEIDQQIFDNVALSLFAILNHNQSNPSEARSQAALADLAGIDHKIDTFVLNNQDGINLEHPQLLQLRLAHERFESQIKALKGAQVEGLEDE